MAESRLVNLIFAQPLANSMTAPGLMRDHVSLPDSIPASRALHPDELSESFFSPHLRGNDVPLAFHRGALDQVTAASTNPYSRVSEARPPAAFMQARPTFSDMSARLEAYGRMLQYRFEDGLILFGHQILYHPFAKHIPRHLLPLTINIRGDLADNTSYILESGMPLGQMRPNWQTQSDKVILSVLLAAQRIIRQAQVNDADSRGPDSLIFTFDDQISYDRTALQLNTVEILPNVWGPWRLTTALLPPQSGVHYGRARVELDPEKVGPSSTLSHSFRLDFSTKSLAFHTFDEQLARLKLQIPRGTPEHTQPVEADPHLQSSSSHKHEPAGLHLSGHTQIQAVAHEIADVLKPTGGNLRIEPDSVTVPTENIHPRIYIGGDGSIKFITQFTAKGSVFEAHGLPQSSAYLLLNLQLGLGATTGYANTQLAHNRRGMKRERDMKVLRNLGSSALIFFEAANYALGLPLSDGTSVHSEEEVCQSLYDRLGTLIMKSEGWPMQSGTLADLCSSNVTTLIQGFVSQVVRDFTGRSIHVYLPEGEIKLEGLSRAVAMFFHAMISDLASETGGACFSRSRTKYFENFMNGRASPEREDLAIRLEVDPEHAARMVYQPGINERYLLPESSHPPKGVNLFALLSKGFDIFIDGKQIEEFAASDFRPEFNLREDSEGDTDVVALGHHKINWFELSPKFFFKGVEISSDQATRLSKDGMIEFDGRLYRVKPNDMPSLKRLTQFWASIQSASAGLMRTKRRRTEDTYYHLPRSQTLELLALRATGVKVRGGPRWDEVTHFYDSLSVEREPLTLPPSFKTQLQPYQITGVQWLSDLYKLGLGGILADDMGLGKTVTTLAFLERLRFEERMGPCLVLVPTSLTYNWLSEAEKFAPEIPTSIFQSRVPESMLDFVQNNRQSLVICTYGLLQEHAEMFQQVDWNIIIFDEAQNLKNITTKRTTVARKMRGSFKLCLTGTPLENHYGEFYSLFDLIVPGSLGELTEFREKYVNPVRVLRDDLDYLRLKAKPLLMRRTKAQVMSELPPKIETTIKLPFEDEQKRIYRDIATSYNEQIRSQIAQHGESKMQLQMLTALLRLRQACSDPSAIPGVKYTGEPPKISTLLEALQEVTESGASALVFTQFLATYDRIRNKLKDAGIPYYDISGADSRLAREKKLKGFQNETAGSVMLMTLKTGGVGLNLTKASYVFHIEPWWNPAVENQATDRAHRIGQLETVQVYRYLIRESVEEKIEILKDLKSKRFDALFAVTENASELGPSGSALTQKDFEFLLS